VQGTSKLSPISVSSKRANRPISLGNYPTDAVCQRDNVTLQERGSIATACGLRDLSTVAQRRVGEAQGASRGGPASLHPIERGGCAQLACQQPQSAGLTAPRDGRATRARGVVVPSVIFTTIREAAFVAAGHLRRFLPMPNADPEPCFRPLVVAVCRSPPQLHHVLSSHDTRLPMSCCRGIAAS